MQSQHLHLIAITISVIQLFPCIILKPNISIISSPPDSFFPSHCPLADYRNEIDSVRIERTYVTVRCTYVHTGLRDMCGPREIESLLFRLSGSIAAPSRRILLVLVEKILEEGRISNCGAHNLPVEILSPWKIAFAMMARMAWGRLLNRRMTDRDTSGKNNISRYCCQCTIATASVTSLFHV